jgi:hypothetical protein
LPRGQSFRRCWHPNLTPHDATERGLYLIFRGGLPVLAPHYRPFDRRREAGVEAAGGVAGTATGRAWGITNWSDSLNSRIESPPSPAPRNLAVPALLYHAKLNPTAPRHATPAVSYHAIPNRAMPALPYRARPLHALPFPAEPRLPYDAMPCRTKPILACHTAPRCSEPSPS